MLRCVGYFPAAAQGDDDDRGLSASKTCADARFPRAGDDGVHRELGRRKC